MTQVQQQVITDILNDVRQQVGTTSFNVWFKNAAHFTLDDKELTVGVPNLFVSDYIEARYSKVLAEIASQRAGAEVPVRFHIDPQLFRERRQQQLDQSEEFLESSTNKPSPDRARPAAAAAEKAQSSGHGNRPLLTLDRFVVGDCNRVAYAAAREVVARPGRSFNPLFIHGPCGLGKTHLLQGVVHEIRRKIARARVLYITAEEFTNRYIMGIKTRSLDAFRHRFRGLDALVIDDIHFLANKRATQEEFLHTFNAFDISGRQVVMASDCHPKLLSCIQENLISRFVSGMVAHLNPPDRATRMHILSRKAQQAGHSFPDDVLEYIATEVTASVRELEGAMVRVVAYATLDHRPVSLPLAREALAGLIRAGRSALNMETIVETVARFFGVPGSDILGPRRTRTITLPRQFAMCLARRMTTLSFPDIGRLMGGKNHTTVIAACKRTEQMVAAGGQTVAFNDGSIERQVTASEIVEALEDQLRN
ncbi:MAG: chromosomal replication initiator protein DnaA [Anaerolineaceae bacterium]|nr:chromosomal replication initiator protein DnaA [Anaerolineaceae bacterium]